MRIEAPDFLLGNELRTLALQGDWDLRVQGGPNGGRLVIEDPGKAHQACLEFLAQVSASNANLAIVPELAIPRTTVKDVVASVRAMRDSIAFIGGVEGLTREEYFSLLDGAGGSQALSDDAAGDYVNAMLIIVKTPTLFVARLRAKRVASREENRVCPPMTVGRGPFITLRLGQAPVIVVPLICSEFVWPEELWTRIDEEIEGDIDFFPVIQVNDDLEARHTGPQLHGAYTRSAKTSRARFLFVNQALGDHCDGACYVVVPPTAPADPAFDHALNELWRLPGPRTYKGFRVPDRTGCIWQSKVSTANAPASALGTRICAGTVIEVLTPTRGALPGLTAGLLRSAAAVQRRGMQPHVGREIYDRAMSVLDVNSATYILKNLTTSVANQVFYGMKCAEWLSWGSVEHTAGSLVEAAALLATGGDEVALVGSEGGNCMVAGRPIAVLYAPAVDAALTAKFPIAVMLEPSTIPTAIVLVDVIEDSTKVDAKRVGEVTRADRVTSVSDALTGIPGRTENSAVTIRIEDVEFHPVTKLRANLSRPSIADARLRLQSLFPKVYA